MDNLLLFDGKSEIDSTTQANTRSPSSNQLPSNKSVEFYIPEVSVDVINTAYERHTSGIMSTYLYHILTKVKLNKIIYVRLIFLLFLLYRCDIFIFRQKLNYRLC